jgi:MoxR-like ATPase
VWFPPEFLPTPGEPEGILFLDELTAADQRLQISAYSLILDRRVGHYRLPDGWQVIAAGNASFHGAVSHDMGTALADRMFHFNVQSAIDAFLDTRSRRASRRP